MGIVCVCRTVTTKSGGRNTGRGHRLTGGGVRRESDDLLFELKLFCKFYFLHRSGGGAVVGILFSTIL